MTSDPRRRPWRQLWQIGSARFGLVLVAGILLLAFGGQWIAPYGADERMPEYTTAAAPSSGHWLGVDADQKDVLSRVIFGSRLSLIAGAISVVVAMVVGAPLGALAGYFGGWPDSIIMRGIDVLLAFPSILVALLVTTAFRPGWEAVVLAVGLISVPMFARHMRVTVMTLKQLDFVEASRALGATSPHILWHAILPGLWQQLLVLATLGLGSAILEVAALSFLGVGGDPTEPEWGSMLAQAKEHLGQSVWPAVGPGIAISLTVLGTYLVGDGLRDVLDPHHLQNREADSPGGS